MIQLYVSTDKKDKSYKTNNPDAIPLRLMRDGMGYSFFVFHQGEHEECTKSAVYCGNDAEQFLRNLTINSGTKTVFAHFTDRQEDMWEIAAGWMEIYPEDASAVIVACASKEDLLNKKYPTI